VRAQHVFQARWLALSPCGPSQLDPDDETVSGSTFFVPLAMAFVKMSKCQIVNYVALENCSWSLVVLITLPHLMGGSERKCIRHAVSFSHCEPRIAADINNPRLIPGCEVSAGRAKRDRHISETPQ
jgi:hypothetical protein